MAIDRTYRCDLCRDSYSSDECNRGLLIGIYWKTNVGRPRHRLEAVGNWREVEHHLCLHCVQAVQSFPSGMPLSPVGEAA